MAKLAGQVYLEVQGAAAGASGRPGRDGVPRPRDRANRVRTGGDPRPPRALDVQVGERDRCTPRRRMPLRRASVHVEEARSTARVVRDTVPRPGRRSVERAGPARARRLAATTSSASPSSTKNLSTWSSCWCAPMPGHAGSTSSRNARDLRELADDRVHAVLALEALAAAGRRDHGVRRPAGRRRRAGRSCRTLAAAAQVLGEATARRMEVQETELAGPSLSKPWTTPGGHGRRACRPGAATASSSGPSSKTMLALEHEEGVARGGGGGAGRRRAHPPSRQATSSVVREQIVRRREDPASPRRCASVADRTLTLALRRAADPPWRTIRCRTSSSTATQRIRSWTAPRSPRSSPRGPPSSATRRSRSPTTTASTARSSSRTRPRRSASGRSPAPRSTLDGGAHVTLLVETPKGYANLCRLLTEAHAGTRPKEGAEPPAARRCRSSRCSSTSDGLVCLSGCARHGLGAHDPNARRARRGRVRPDRFYVELQRPYERGDARRNAALRELARDLGVADRRHRRRPRPPRAAQRPPGRARRDPLPHLARRLRAGAARQPRGRPARARRDGRPLPAGPRRRRAHGRDRRRPDVRPDRGARLPLPRLLRRLRHPPTSSSREVCDRAFDGPLRGVSPIASVREHGCDEELALIAELEARRLLPPPLGGARARARGRRRGARPRLAAPRAAARAAAAAARSARSSAT